MKNRLLQLTLTTCLLAVGVTAMADTPKQEPRWSHVNSPAMGYRSEVSKGDNDVDFTYYKGTPVDYTGYDGQKLQSAAIAVDPTALQGMKIKSIYAVGFMNSTEFSAPVFWISSKLDHNHNIVEHNSILTEGRAEAVLETPVEVPQNTFYVGYDLNVSAEYGSFIPYSTGTPVPGTCYLTYGVYDFSDYSGFCGPLTIGLILENENGQSENSLLLTSFGASTIVKPGDPITVKVNAINNGKAPVERFAYEYLFDNRTHHMDVTLPNAIEPNLAEPTTVELALDPIEKEGTYSVQISAVEVNGESNPGSGSVATADVTVQLPPDISVLDGTTPFAYTTEAPNDWYFAGGRKCVYDVGMKIDSPELKGMEIVGLRVTGLTRTNGVGNFKGWLTTELGNTFDVETVETGNPDEKGDLVIIFKKPYKLEEGGVYAGYSCEALEVTDDSKKCIPLYVTMEEGKFTNGCLINTGYGWSDEGYWNGCATTITAYLRGELAPDNLSLGKMISHSVVEKDKTYSLTFEVNNNGSNNIESMTYTYEIAGEKKTNSCTLSEAILPGIGSTSRVTLDFDGVAEAGSYPMKVTVTEVNGNVNTATKKMSDCRLDVIEHAVKHNVLMEEATGTWCGYCPRGWLAMRELSKKYPEFIGIAYHNNDPMTVGQIPFNNAGFPYASLDRTVNADPFFGTANNGTFGMADDWAAIQKRLTIGEISIEAFWNDDSRSSIDVNSSVSFVLPVENALYQIGYVLVGNGYSHPEKITWNQKNYYSGGGETGLLSELAALPDRIKDMVYDDVVIDSHASSGVEESLPSSMSLNEVYKHKFTFQTESILGQTGDELLTDKDKLEVVAFIIGADGKIINAAKAAPTRLSVPTFGDGSVAIKNIYYTLDGIAVNNPVRGFYVVKTIMSDGSCKVRKTYIP